MTTFQELESSGFPMSVASLKSFQISPCVLCVVYCPLSSLILAVPSPPPMQAYPLYLAAYVSFLMSPNTKQLLKCRGPAPGVQPVQELGQKEEPY